MTAILMALSASGAWGVSDFLGGLKAKTVPVSSVLLISQTAGLALVAVVLLASGDSMPTEPRLALGLLAGVAAAVDLGLIYLVLARGPVILIAPIAALGASVPVLVGLLGGDPASPVVLAGLVCALLGSLAASYDPAGGEPGTPGASGGLLAGLPLALGAAAGIGVTLILLDRASDVDPLWATGALRVGGFASAVLLAVAVLIRRRGGPRAPLAIPAGIVATLGLIGLFDVLADLGYSFASTHGDLSTVSVLASLYPVVTVLLGYAVLRERVAAVQLAGVGLALAGIALLAGAAG